MTIYKTGALVLAIGLVLCLSSGGCGYILHPERRDRPHTKKVDTTTVVFDCLWLLPGIIPGVVALVLDSVHETWYYAKGEPQGCLQRKTRERVARPGDRPSGGPAGDTFR